MGVVLDSHTRSKDIVAVDLWHAGAVFVPSGEELVEIVVLEDIPPK